jgi:predicted helicase
VISTRSREANQVFPLYLYLGRTKVRLLGEGNNRRVNFSPQFIDGFASRFGMSFVFDKRGDNVTTFGPEDLFHYIYAVLHSPTYRSRYVEFLKGDFPRIPFTSDAGLFRKLCVLGADLVALHLLVDEYEAASWHATQSNGKNPFKTLITRFTGKGDTEVAKGYPQYNDRNVYINPSQYFERVPEEVWSFHVGGYQVCAKWLKDRRGRTLSDEDINFYRRIVVALNETIRLMAEIDRVIEEHGGWPLVGSQDVPKTEPSGGLPFS